MIYDVTNKKNPRVIAQRDYPEAAYTHQGWLTEDQRYFLFGDELDEQGGTVDNTTTYIMDVKNLDDLREPKPFAHKTTSIDHNLFIHEGLVHESNYAAGHRILDFSKKSLKNGKLNEVGFFDTRPGVDAAEFVGTWSNYPYFDSGIVLTTDIEAGSVLLFVLRPTGAASGDEKKKNDGPKKNDDDPNKDPDGNGNNDGTKNDDDPAQRDPDAGVVASEGSILSTTGVQIMFVLLLGLVLIAAGAALLRLRRRETPTA